MQDCFVKSFLLWDRVLSTHSLLCGGWFLPSYLKSNSGLHWDHSGSLRYLFLQPRNNEPGVWLLPWKCRRQTEAHWLFLWWSQVSAAAFALACVPRICHRNNAWVYPMRLVGEREAWGGPGSCPVGSFEESGRPQHKEATSVPCGLRRKLQETQNKAASTKVRRTAGMPPLNICLAHRAQNHPVRQELFHRLTSLHLGPEWSAAIRAIRWRDAEKGREYTDHSSPSAGSLA